MDPSGKVCIITGGAQGLGKEVAGHLLRRGAKVCLLDILQDQGRQTATALQSEHGTERVMFIHCDVTNKDDMEAAFNKVVTDFGGLDILFNNAGVHGYIEPKERIIDINLHGAIHATELAISHMSPDRGGNGGVIVCVSSIVGVYPAGLAAEYHAGKTGIIGYTKSRALECGEKYGINFRILAPAAMKTPMWDDFQDKAPMDDVYDVNTTVPLEDQPDIEPEKVARTVMMCIEKNDLPQGALIKINRNGTYLLFPEKIPFEKLSDS